MSINDIKFDHFKNIEELIQHLEMWYAEDDYDSYNRFFGLRDARIMGMIIYQLTNNWNELEEWVESEYNRYYNDTENLVLSNVETMDYSRMLDKMKEIKDGNNEG